MRAFWPAVRKTLQRQEMRQAKSFWWDEQMKPKTTILLTGWECGALCVLSDHLISVSEKRMDSGANLRRTALDGTFAL